MYNDDYVIKDPTKLEHVDVAPIEAASGDLAVMADELKLETKSDFQKAATIRTGIKAMLDEVASTFDPVIAAAHKSHKEAIAAKRKHTSPLETADSKLKLAMESWASDEREATKRALTAGVDQARVASAVEMINAGNEDEAAELLARVGRDLPVEVKGTKVDGASTRISYEYEVVDESAIKDEWWLINHSAIGKEVRSRGYDAEQSVGGIMVREKVIIARR